eukprot:GDKI01040243.1.p1 GENE.GDKI01040243.1~~GDKI01040243.1.p1  ORF type:complete len:133 (-),score=34.57 GDKI01040243.1:34-432(-)
MLCIDNNQTHAKDTNARILWCVCVCVRPCAHVCGFHAIDCLHVTEMCAGVRVRVLYVSLRVRFTCVCVRASFFRLRQPKECISSGYVSICALFYSHVCVRTHLFPLSACLCVCMLCAFCKVALHVTTDVQMD